jgi:hypothetical protein
MNLLIVNEELSYESNIFAGIEKKVVNARGKDGLNKLLIQLQNQYQDIELLGEI